MVQDSIDECSTCSGSESKSSGSCRSQHQQIETNRVVSPEQRKAFDLLVHPKATSSTDDNDGKKDSTKEDNQKLSLSASNSSKKPVSEKLFLKSRGLYRQSPVFNFKFIISNLVLVLLWSSSGRGHGSYKTNIAVCAAELRRARDSTNTLDSTTTTTGNNGKDETSQPLDPDDPLFQYEQHGGGKEYPDIDEFYHHQDIAKKRKMLYERSSSFTHHDRKKFEEREKQRKRSTAKSPPKFFNAEWEQKREAIVQKQRFQRFNQDHPGDEL